MALARPNLRFSTTLYQATDDSQTTLFLNAVPVTVPCYLILEPKTDKEEIVKVTAKSTNSATVVRAQGGTSATDHSVGAAAVDYNIPQYFEDLADAYENVFNDDGMPKEDGTLVTLDGDQALTNKTIDYEENEILNFPEPEAVPTDGWTEITDTLVYVSANSFKIVGVDRTAVYTKGTRIKLTQTSAKYFVVTGSSFATDTTVTITAGTDYTLASATITAPFYSYQAKPQGYPGSFAYTVTITPGGSLTYGSVTQDCTFSITGDVCTWSYFSSGVFGGSTNAFMDVTAPLQPAENRQYMGGTGVYFLSGVSQEICSFMLKITSSTTFQVSRYTSGNAFPASGTGILSWSWSYRI